MRTARTAVVFYAAAIGNKGGYCTRQMERHPSKDETKLGEEKKTISCRARVPRIIQLAAIGRGRHKKAETLK